MFFIIGLSLLFLFVGWGLSYRSKNVDLEQSSPYECGFAAFQGSRNCFSVRFFLLAILFVVFDIELVVLLPLGFMGVVRYGGLTFINIGGFVLILYLGLIYE